MIFCCYSHQYPQSQLAVVKHVMWTLAGREALKARRGLTVLRVEEVQSPNCYTATRHDLLIGSQKGPSTRTLLRGTQSSTHAPSAGPRLNSLTRRPLIYVLWCFPRLLIRAPQWQCPSYFEYWSALRGKCEGGLVNIDPFDIYLCELIKTIGNCSEKKFLTKFMYSFKRHFS